MLPYADALWKFLDVKSKLAGASESEIQAFSAALEASQGATATDVSAPSLISVSCSRVHPLLVISSSNETSSKSWSINVTRVNLS